MADELRLHQEMVQSLSYANPSSLIITSLDSQVLITKTSSTLVTLAGVTFDSLESAAFDKNTVNISEITIDILSSGYYNSINIPTITVDVLTQNRYNTLIGFMGIEIISRVIPPVALVQNMAEVIYSASGVRGLISEEVLEVVRYDQVGPLSISEEIVSVLKHNNASSVGIAQMYVSTVTIGDAESYMRDAGLLVEVIRKNNVKRKWYKMLISY